MYVYMYDVCTYNMYKCIKYTLDWTVDHYHREELMEVHYIYLGLNYPQKTNIYYPPEVRSVKYCRLGAFM